MTVPAGKSKSKVIHVTSWLSREGGGIPPVIWALARESRRRGIDATVIGLKDRWVEADCAGNGLPFEAGGVVGPRALGFSPGLKKHLGAQAKGIIHSHGLWMYPGLAARACADDNGCRLVVSPHGMLEPWALNNSRLKKKLVARLFENRNLRRADCLHALCPAEADNFRSYGLRNPIAVIPNGVDIEETPQEGDHAAAESLPGKNDRRRVLFLSRLHPKKGLANLLQAWRNVARDFRDWQLLIAGGGAPAYEQELKSSAQDLLSQERVIFCGPIYGGIKRQMLAEADLFVLPSFSEGFSVAILEAAAAGLPVLLTRECNFRELADAGGAVEIFPDASAVEEGLRRLLKLPEEQRKAMGRRGQHLVKTQHSWSAVGQKMCAVYEWLLGNGSMPETIRTS